jgi:endoglucanase
MFWVVSASWWRAVAIGPLLLLALFGPSVAPVRNSPPPSTGNLSWKPVEVGLVDAPNPLSGKGFYVDPTASAVVAATQEPDSSELRRIAETPQARWIGNEVAIDTVAQDVANYIGSAESAGELPLLVLYAIPHRDCGNFAAGGFSTAEDYRQWIAQIVDGLGMSRIGIVLEPDALTAADCLSDDQRRERMELLRDAVSRLTRNPNAAVYVDAGHSRWLPPDELARRLTAVGVSHARGFALNTANFFSTDEEIAYGEAVSRLTNGAHYVVDTSRNGSGPAPDAPLNWCNPLGRAVGSVPTTETAGTHADAYLWVKRPGESDGECRRDDPRAGIFMPQYAVELVRNAGS